MCKGGLDWRAYIGQTKEILGNILVSKGIFRYTLRGVVCEGGDWHIWAVRERAGLELSCVCILSCCFYASILKYSNLIQEIGLGKSCKLSLSTCWRGINKGGTFYQAMEDFRREVILGVVS